MAIALGLPVSARVITRNGDPGILRPRTQTRTCGLYPCGIWGAITTSNDPSVVFFHSFDYRSRPALDATSAIV